MQASAPVHFGVLEQPIWEALARSQGHDCTGFASPIIDKLGMPCHLPQQPVHARRELDELHSLASSVLIQACVCTGRDRCWFLSASQNLWFTKQAQRAESAGRGVHGWSCQFKRHKRRGDWAVNCFATTIHSPISCSLVGFELQSNSRHCED